MHVSRAIASAPAFAAAAKRRGTGGGSSSRQADRLHRHVVIGEGEIVDGHVHRPERELGVGERTGLAHASVCRSDLRVHSGELRVRRRRDPDRLSEPGAPVAGGLRRNRNGIQDQSSEDAGKIAYELLPRDGERMRADARGPREAGGSDPVDGEGRERDGGRPRGGEVERERGSGVGKGCGNRRRPPSRTGATSIGSGRPEASRRMRAPRPASRRECSRESGSNPTGSRSLPASAANSTEAGAASRRPIGRPIRAR